MPAAAFLHTVSAAAVFIGMIWNWSFLPRIIPVKEPDESGSRYSMKKALTYLLKWGIIFIIASLLVFIIVRMMPSTPVDKWLDAYHLSILFITHDLSVARSVSDRVMVMREGKIRGIGLPEEVFSQEADPYITELASSVFTFRGRG